MGELTLPGKAKATFAVHLPGGEWDKSRVGVTWFPAERKEPAVAWSEALGKEKLEPKEP